MTQAARRLRRDRGFALVAVATLGAGIGLTTALFSVVNGVLLAPLHFPEPERIVSVNTVFLDAHRNIGRLSGGDLSDLRAQVHSFDALSRVYGGDMGVQLGSSADFTSTYLVDPAFFQVFSTQPLAGRAPRAGQAAVAAGFAMRHFGSAQAALGHTVSVEKQIYEIAAVMPEGFHYPRQAQLWLALEPRIANLNRSAYNFPTVARLAPGVSLQAAASELEGFGARLRQSLPGENKNKGFVPVPLRDQLTGPVRGMLLILLGAVSLLLLIACANVANLMLARGTVRARELALRAALGASPARLLRLLFAESLILAAAAALTGWVLAALATGALLRLAPENLPRLTEVRVDQAALLFASAIAVCSSLLFSLAPAWQAWRTDVNDTLKQAGGRSAAGGSSRLRSTLVVVEIALAFVLAVGAGLLLKSFNGLLGAELGFRSDGVLVMYAHLPAGTEAEYVKAGETFDQLLERVRALPGVSQAALAMGMPAGQYNANGGFAIEGRHVFESGQKLPDAGLRLTGPGYFATLGIPLLRGRDFTASDTFPTEPVVIISQALARQHFPNENPLGHRIQCGLDRLVWMRVVGVVGDVRSESPAAQPYPELYMPVRQHPFAANELQVAVRAGGDPALLTAALREAVRQTDPGIATRFTTLRSMVDSSISAPRFRTLLVGLFAALALLFAMAGIHSLMAYAVARRSAEFGLRAALGATAADISTLVLGHALALGGVGIAAGAALSVALGRVLEAMLVGVKPTDPVLFAIAIPAVLAALVAAVAVPAVRAARVDPLTALRQD